MELNTVLKAHNEVYNKEFDEKKLTEISAVRTLLEEDGIKAHNEDGSLNMAFIKPINTSKAYLTGFSVSIAKAIEMKNKLKADAKAETESNE